jgi:hypothetical protein
LAETPALVARAGAILAAEALRLPPGATGPSLASSSPRLPEPAAVVPSGPQNLGQNVLDVVGGLAGAVKGGLPFGASREALRAQAHELVDTLLLTFRDATGEERVPSEPRVPVIHTAPPTAAGGVARAFMTVVNEESEPSEVSLYCTSLLADSGHEIPAICIALRPRVATLASNARLDFEIEVAVPAQAAAGPYSGLLQVAGSRYTKAVLVVEVT